MIKNRIDVVTMGCSKNLVDSELLMRQLIANGYTLEHDPETPKGEIAVINTCGFIGDAKEESINMILSFAEAKKERGLKKLYVMGCLSERYREELQKEIPEVDKFYGKFDWRGLISDLGKSYNKELEFDRSLSTPPHYAYLKISEGCDRTCSYCSIPIITGKYKSRPIEDIEDEVRRLVTGGVKEFQFIAQDLTYYGIDLYKSMKLPELVERISDIKGVEWIRLHYAYPAHFPVDLLRVMRERDNVCNYLDIALQHISDRMLKIMRRNITKQQTYDLIKLFRNEVPGIHIRTTMMVGHPGETEEDFNELVDFVKEMKFERLGAFPYSHEEDTYNDKNYSDDVPASIKQERMNTLMDMQEGIALSVNETKVGQTMKVIIDREDSDYFVGRTEFDSPEVDGEVLISKAKDLVVGEFYNVRIEAAYPFDLLGTVI
ncbi:MAG TPA: 30S ribosomal protein S12 methylthiotransferase RimO [Fermentimonas caenicola]|jgi:ribosomal protein S12 methylthiotransferase|uniref:Ribosomal protein uS12 methylthiotransferase RimO n=1 Tax=Fermentimonas caenicola TaxID=1562970 RepID=A0A098BY98_9BACT|nr:30S ribosomal protein S12 methylthiotransferase RimO [Lascolabacillus massiliensis]MBP6174851.1 30S ribosomal protein S12 methylthiotransferase RimO [Fermentimonas sp.]MCK9501596.1 30S ribosomal protein S12 methylthiotransferase RimO [Lascolabacillus sp.]MDI9626211.1 30S ribosomal protein S12 methylthiotransferase RimO [Bacteroidota bacterium]TAH61087.1 MAG: 30S ribosomal protein S12 methylthiotransferase RimO [Fermentimonas caenicola]MBP7104125.1 30S ribosomal protein S12 methylthiotransfe